MPSFSMAELVKLAAPEQPGHETSQDYVPVSWRIYDVVAEQGRVSRAQIAAALHLKKTPYLHRHIEQLVYDGRLERTQTIRPNGVVMFWYEVRGLPSPE